VSLRRSLEPRGRGAGRTHGHAPQAVGLLGVDPPRPAMHRNWAAVRDRPFSHRRLVDAAPPCVFPDRNECHVTTLAGPAAADPADPKLRPDADEKPRAARPRTKGAREVPGDSITTERSKKDARDGAPGAAAARRRRIGSVVRP